MVVVELPDLVTTRYMETLGGREGGGNKKGGEMQQKMVTEMDAFIKTKSFVVVFL